LPLVLLVCKQFWKFGKHLPQDEETLSIVREIESLHKEAEHAKTEWKLHKSHLEHILRWNSDLVDSYEHKLKRLLNTLQDKVEIIQEIPSGVFREFAGDERATQIVQILLDCVKYEMGSSMDLNELADLYGNMRNVSRDTAKSHIKSVLLDTSLVPSKGKMPAKVLHVVRKCM
jgi:hypothetical protein